MESMEVENIIHNWSSLQSELLFDISKRFDTRIDLLRFRDVCTSWRYSSVPLLPKIPFLKIPIPKVSCLGIDEYIELYDHFVLTESTIYSIQPIAQVKSSLTSPTSPITSAKAKKMKETCEAFIIKAEELQSGDFRLIFPLSNAYLRHLDNQMPKISKLYGNVHLSSSSRCTLFQDFNLLDYRVKEMGKAYGFKPMGVDFCYSFAEVISVHKVVVSSNFNNIGDGFTVMIVDEFGGLYAWKVGDKEWTKINFKKYNDEWLFCFVDIIFHEGKFYALDFIGLTITIDPENFETMQVASEKTPRNSPRVDFDNSYREQMYLVESLGDLFWIENLVDCFERFEDGFERVEVVIYKLDNKEKEWVRVERLEDRVFFLGDDSRFSFSTKDFQKSKGSYLYFKFRFGCVYTNDFLGVIELENGNLGSGKISYFSPFDSYFKMLYPSLN